MFYSWAVRDTNKNHWNTNCHNCGVKVEGVYVTGGDGYLWDEDYCTECAVKLAQEDLDDMVKEIEEKQGEPKPKYNVIVHGDVQGTHIITGNNNKIEMRFDK